MTEAEIKFHEMCQRHDLTYSYSDDSRYYRAGSQSEKELRAFAKANLTNEQAAKIWNEIVDKKLIEGHREPFYWRNV